MSPDGSVTIYFRKRGQVKIKLWLKFGAQINGFLLGIIAIETLSHYKVLPIF